ncbi:MAG TPA: hypothetical protein VL979_09150 [Solirubrobacteraceae bacterium]|nr:hypothetical protein [Solirubrobacteraceae bacterium]
MIDHVRSTIIEYLAGRFSADGLAERLPDPCELDEAGADEFVRELTLRAVGYLAEFERGDRNEGALREALIPLVVMPEQPTVLGSEKTDTVMFASSGAIQLAGTPHQAVPA